MSALWAATVPWWEGWTCCGVPKPTDQGRRPSVPHRMLGAEFQGESRVRENFTHGLVYEAKPSLLRCKASPGSHTAQ